MPLEGHRLRIEPRYPHADDLMEVTGVRPREYGSEGGEEHGIRNKWWSQRLRKDVFVVNSNEQPGKVFGAAFRRGHDFAYVMRTLDCQYAWGIEQEANAVHLLGTLIRHHQFKQYMMTGMFAEKSKRSGVTYLFRRLRPTVAIDAKIREDKPDEPARILCCLCMHPIAYYEGTFAGAMCPTDDVIAHLMLMRGDEAMYWRRANQHPPHVPEAGLMA